MPYVALSDIEGKIPPAYLLQALDDDNDGVIDAWDAVAAEVGTFIDGVLGGRYEVPFTAPLPPVVVTAAQILACEMCYSRRGVTGEANPKTAQETAIRSVLNKIAEGKAPLTPGKKTVNPPGKLISEDSRLFDPAGRRW